MKISTEIGMTSGRVGEEKAVEMVAKAGFDAWDFSMFVMPNYDKKLKMPFDNDHPLAGKDYLKFARRLKQIGLDNGIICNQGHAPFPVWIPEIYSCMKRAIECVAEAGGNICVIHPDNFKSAEENAEMFFELLPFAKQCGVKIATENMWTRDHETKQLVHAACCDHDDFLKHMETVNDDYFVACVDIGHANMYGKDITTPEKMIRTLGKNVQALHIHDNDGANDSHKIPFSMTMDYDPIVKALKDIGYDGYFTLEASLQMKGLELNTDEEVFAEVKKMADSTRKLANMFEAL